METILESAIATGNVWIVATIALAVVVVYLYKMAKEYSDKNHDETVERLEKLEDKYESEHVAYVEATNKFAETIQEINSTLVVKVESILDALDELGVGDGEDEEVGE